MGLDHQILLKSPPPLNLLAGTAPIEAKPRLQVSDVPLIGGLHVRMCPPIQTDAVTCPLLIGGQGKLNLT